MVWRATKLGTSARLKASDAYLRACSQSPRSRTVLKSTADLCTEFGRIRDVDDLKRVLARAAEVRQLLLTHFSPALVDPPKYAARAEGIFPQTAVGHDHFSLSLKFS